MANDNGLYPTTFKDALNESWTVQYEYAASRRVIARTGIILDEIFDRSSESSRKFISDRFAPLDCLCAVLEKRLAEKGISDEEFAERLNNEELMATAIECLEKAVINFFRQSRRLAIGTALERNHAAVTKLIEANAAEAMRAVEQTDWDQVAVRALMHGNSASGSLESAESIPDHSPSES